MADVGAVWHLRYRDAGAAGKKWEFVGGAGLDVTLTTAPSAVTVTSPASLSTNPTLKLPLAGDYQIEIFSNAASTASAIGAGYLSLDYSGGMTEAATVTGGSFLYGETTSNNGPIYATRLKTITGAATVLTMKAWVTAAVTFYPNAASTYAYGIRATPIRVG